MNKLPDAQNLQSRIYRLRGQQVMLSQDLAELYGVPTKVLLQAVRRNVERFPLDFLFQLSRQEWDMARSLRSQIVTLNSRGKHPKYRPYAFTEQGVAMLSSVLRSRQAIQVNIAIVRAFIKLRHALASHRDLAQRFEKLEGKVRLHDTDIRLLVEDIQNLQKTTCPSQQSPRVRGFLKE